MSLSSLANGPDDDDFTNEDTLSREAESPHPDLEKYLSVMMKLQAVLARTGSGILIETSDGSYHAGISSGGQIVISVNKDFPNIGRISTIEYTPGSFVIRRNPAQPVHVRYGYFRHTHDNSSYNEEYPPKDFRVPFESILEGIDKWLDAEAKK